MEEADAKKIKNFYRRIDIDNLKPTDNKDELLGKTAQDERIAFIAPENLIGKFVQVKIDSLSGNTFRGTLV